MTVAANFNTFITVFQLTLIIEFFFNFYGCALKVAQ